MNILITGHKGFIGSSLALELGKDPNNKTHGIDFSFPYGCSLIPYSCDAEHHVNLANTELNDLIYWIKEFNIDVILHQAALISANESILNPYVYYKNNIQSTNTLLEAAHQVGVKKFIFASSAAVYGNRSINNMIDPMNPYGDSKAICENIISRYREYKNLNAISLRYFNVFGPGQNSNNLISKVIDCIIFNRPFFYSPSNLDNTRDYIHINDVIKANIACIQNDVLPFNTYDICSGISFSLNDVLQIFDTIAKKYNLKLNLEINQKEIKEVKSVQGYSDPYCLLTTTKQKSRQDIVNEFIKTFDWYYEYYKVGKLAGIGTNLS